MTKAELVTEISDLTGVEQNVARQIVEAAMSVIKDKMSDGENIYLRGFGSFVIKRRAQKMGRVISKNTSIVIPEHSVPAFKPAKVFASQVKNTKAKENQTSEPVD
jgi:DNA-binding protein HU-beta